MAGKPSPLATGASSVCVQAMEALRGRPPMDGALQFCFQARAMSKKQSPKQDARSQRLAAALKRNITRRKAAQSAKTDKK